MQWFAVATQPSRENLAIAQLRRQNFNSFLPLRRKTVRHARKTSEVCAPLFPGYLFVSFNENAKWRSVNGTPGVRHLVSAGERPLPLPPGFVETLLERSDASGLVNFSSTLTPGDKVVVLSGPFAEQIGLLEAADGNGRVRILIELFSTSTPVQMPASNLMLA